MRLIPIVALILLPLGAAAQNPICAPTGEIVQSAVDARRSGQDAASATQEIRALQTGERAGYVEAVQPLVDWVYTLDETQLAQDVAGAWVAQCEAQ